MRVWIYPFKRWISVALETTLQVVFSLHLWILVVFVAVFFLLSSTHVRTCQVVACAQSSQHTFLKLLHAALRHAAESQMFSLLFAL